MRIVVPLDRSVFGERAIPHALGLVDGGTLALVTAVDPMLEPTGGLPELETLMLTASQNYLDEVAGMLPPSVNVETHVLGNPVTAAISQFAEKFEADLIVMSTHGRGPVSRFWLGSVADRLTRATPVPLYLIRPEKDKEGRPDLSVAVAAPAKILIPVDGSELSEAAVYAAQALGSADDKVLHLLRISQVPVFMTSGYMPQTIESNREIAVELLALGEKETETLAKRLRGEGLNILSNVVSGEFVAPAILDYASTWGASAIALSTHGRSGFTRMALGSVADKVVRQSDFPVLLVRATEEDG